MSYELNKYGLRMKDMDFLENTFRKYPVDKAVLFGSRARGDHRLASGVDVALWGNLSETERRKIHFQLEDDSPTLLRFDILLFSEVENPSLKEEGTVIYTKIPALAKV